jgi:hypothetical protein
MVLGNKIRVEPVLFCERYGVIPELFGVAHIAKRKT